MGKSSRGKEERRAAATEQPEGLSRRGWLVGAAAAGAALFTEGDGRHTGDKAAVPQEQAGSISQDEIARIYARLFQQVEKAYKHAKLQNKKKPFRIFMGDLHNSSASLAYDAMLARIAKGLGMDILIELPPKEIIEGGSMAKLGSLKNPPTLYLYAKNKLGITPKRTDVLCPTSEEFAKLAHDTIVSYAVEDLQAAGYVRAGYNPIAHYDINQSGEAHVSFLQDYWNPLSAGQQQSILAVTKAAFERAMDAISALREPLMIKEIKKSGDAFVLNGARHLYKIVPEIRKETDEMPKTDAAGLCFTLTPKILNGPGTDMSEAAMSWLSDPKNKVIFLEEKAFPPLSKVDEACAMAEKKFHLNTTRDSANIVPRN